MTAQEVNDRPYGVVICLLPYSLKIWYFRQVCRGRIDASRAVLPIYRNIRAAATGGIVAVPTNDPQNCHHRKTRGGHSFFLISYFLFLIYSLDTLVFLRGLCYPKTGLAPKYCAVLPICRRRQQEEN